MKRFIVPRWVVFAVSLLSSGCALSVQGKGKGKGLDVQPQVVVPIPRSGQIPIK